MKRINNNKLCQVRCDTCLNQFGATSYFTDETGANRFVYSHHCFWTPTLEELEAKVGTNEGTCPSCNEATVPINTIPNDINDFCSNCLSEKSSMAQ